jgi:hypothetical protein
MNFEHLGVQWYWNFNSVQTVFSYFFVLNYSCSAKINIASENPYHLQILSFLSQSKLLWTRSQSVIEFLFSSKWKVVHPSTLITSDPLMNTNCLTDHSANFMMRLVICSKFGLIIIDILFLVQINPLLKMDNCGYEIDWELYRWCENIWQINIDKVGIWFNYSRGSILEWKQSFLKSTLGSILFIAKPIFSPL